MPCVRSRMRSKTTSSCCTARRTTRSSSGSMKLAPIASSTCAGFPSRSPRLRPRTRVPSPHFPMPTDWAGSRSECTEAPLPELGEGVGVLSRTVWVGRGTGSATDGGATNRPSRRSHPMSTRAQLLQQWDQQLRQLLPAVRVTRVATLALLSLGLLWAGSVTLLKVASSLPLSAYDLSRVRRLRRWLANPAVAVGQLWPPLVTALLACRAGQELCLVYDPTPLADRLTVLVLGLVVHKRILPVAWHPMPQQTRWPVRQVTVLRRLTRQLARCLPTDCTVTLLADRGVTGADLLDLCHTRGWHFVLRVSASAGSSPTIRLADDTECPLWSLVTGPGQ